MVSRAFGSHSMEKLFGRLKRDRKKINLERKYLERKRLVLFSIRGSFMRFQHWRLRVANNSTSLLIRAIIGWIDCTQESNKCGSSCGSILHLYSDA